MLTVLPWTVCCIVHMFNAFSNKTIIITPEFYMKVDFQQCVHSLFYFIVLNTWNWVLQSGQCYQLQHGTAAVSGLHFKLYALYLALRCSEGMWEAWRQHVMAKWVALPASNLGSETDFLVWVIVVVIIFIIVVVVGSGGGSSGGGFGSGSGSSGRRGGKDVWMFMP
jgi:Beta-propeller domains of methanol dehydrogenase type